MSINTSKIGSTGTSSNSGIHARKSVLVVKQTDSIESLAKQFGMSKENFKKWAAINGSIRPGQKINLPTATVEKGKGIYALAREYEMSMSEFCKMNGISNPQDYMAKEGEVFYVIRPTNTKTKTKKTRILKENSDYKPTGGATASAHGAILGKIIRWGSSYSPQELADKLYIVADKKVAAVGRPDFDGLIKEINHKNAREVLDSYKNLKNNSDHDTLLKTITGEVGSTKESRIKAVMAVYDALAAQVNAPADLRNSFMDELNSQFSKTFGRVDTKSLDNMLNNLMKLESPGTGITSNSAKAEPTKPQMNPAQQKLSAE